MYFASLFLCLLSIRLAKAIEYPCPFNKLECSCQSNSPSSSSAISLATCNSLTSALPNFTAPLNVTYDPYFLLSITSDSVFNLPANYFAIFESIIIYHLNLMQTPSALGAVIQKWDDAAFDGARINEIAMCGLAGLIPPPIALTRLGAKNLTALAVVDAGTPVRLEDQTFVAFPFLTSLIITGTAIEKIGDNVFADLSDLQILELMGTSLSEFPFETVNCLPKLQHLYLDNNPIVNLPRLTWPHGMYSISLRGTSLTSVDLSLFDCLQNCMDRSVVIDLGFNTMLKNVTGAAGHLNSWASILLTNSNLETVDPRLGDLMEGNRGIAIDISSNPNLLCDNAAWMAYYASCTGSLKITYAQCADKGGMLLEQYLKNIVSDPCSDFTTPHTEPSTRFTVTTAVGTSRIPNSTAPYTASSTNFTIPAAHTSRNPSTMISSTLNPTTRSIIITTTTPHETRPCPFNSQECVCTDINPPDPLIFFKAECASSTLPNFFAPVNKSAKYAITSTLTIRSNVSSISIRHFAAFKFIGTLSLIQTKTRFPTFQKWDELAFDLVKIRSFRVTGLEGVLPPPAALRRLGGRGLKTLVITEGTVSVYLNDYSFDAFPTLASLTLDNTNIVQISDQAFSGMEDHLDTLVIRGSSLIQFPSTALSELSNLQSLKFEDSTISEIPEKAFLPFSSLLSLSLSGNLQLGAAIINESALDQVSSKLTHLWLNKTGLAVVPRDLAKNQPLLQFADLSSNFIETIENENFQYSSSLNQLHLGDNPISTIENEAFAHLEKTTYINLSNTSLMSIDLSIFDNVQSSADLNLDDNHFLKSVTAASINQIPSNARVSIRNSSLEVIDCKIADLLKHNPNVSIEISNNVQLLCNVHAWMANATCPEQLKIDGARCADKNGQLLSDYLKSIKPSTTCINNVF